MRRHPQLARTIVGGFFLSMGGVHLGIVFADPQTYRHFADAALLPFVRDGWADVFMAAPVAWGLGLCAGETVIGALLLARGRAAKVGWCTAIAFHMLLMLFGWGFWLWSVPVLAALLVLARSDWPSLTAPGRHTARRSHRSSAPPTLTRTGPAR